MMNRLRWPDSPNQFSDTPGTIHWDSNNCSGPPCDRWRYPSSYWRIADNQSCTTFRLRWFHSNWLPKLLKHE